MAFGLAALAAWGMEQFQAQIAGLQVPLPEAGETAEAIQLRIDEYTANLNQVGISLFQNFYRVAAGLMLIGIIPSLWLSRSLSSSEGSGDTEESQLQYQSKA